MGGKEAPMSQTKRRIGPGVALVAAVGLLLLTAGGALAQGPPVVKVTERLVNEPTTDIGVHPCTGQPAELTLVESGVIHFSAFADGTVHLRARCAAPSLSTPCPRTESRMPPAGSSSGSAATACCSRRAAPSARLRPRSP
jgi:hypothetical protein